MLNILILYKSMSILVSISVYIDIKAGCRKQLAKEKKRYKGWLFGLLAHPSVPAISLGFFSSLIFNTSFQHESVVFSMTEISKKMLFLSQISMKRNKDREFQLRSFHQENCSSYLPKVATFDFKGPDQASTDVYYIDLQQT